MVVQEAPGGEPDQDAALLNADEAAKLATAEGPNATLLTSLFGASLALSKVTCKTEKSW